MVLLINPKTTKVNELNIEFFREPNTGLLYLAAILDLNEIFVEILDIEQYSHLNYAELDKVIQEKLVGHKIFGITSLTNTFVDAISIAKIIKNNDPNNIIIFGGPHVSFLYKNILERDYNKEKLIDFICVGESEYSFLKLVKILKRINIKYLKKAPNFEQKINSIEGIAFINSKQKFKYTGNQTNLIDLSRLPLPARFKLSPTNYYYSVANVIVNRGCPNQCSFCSRQKLFKTTRLRDLDSIAEEIRDIKSLQSYNFINFYDNINYNSAFFKDFCNLLKKDNLNINWGCEIRIDNINENYARLIKEAGCKIIATGIESANKEVLRRNFKYQDPNKVKEGIEIIKKNNIPIQAYFVLGLPGETEESFQETLEFIKKLPLDEYDKINYFMATPYPGSKLWNNYDSFGIKIIDHEFSNYDCEHIIFETSELKKNQLKSMFKEAKEIESYFSNN